jgi:hypothetical protein
VPPRPGAIPVRRLPPHNGQPLPPRPRTPSRDAFVTRHQQGFTHVRPSSLPLTCGHQTARQPLGFPLSSTPPGTRYPGACQGGNRSPALTRATCPASAEPPSRNHSQRATSCRNRSQNRTASSPAVTPAVGSIVASHRVTEKIRDNTRRAACTRTCASRYGPRHGWMIGAAAEARSCEERRCDERAGQVGRVRLPGRERAFPVPVAAGHGLLAGAIGTLLLLTMLAG